MRRNGYFRATRSSSRRSWLCWRTRDPYALATTQVTVSNESLRRANSRNYHHIYPRAFLRRRGFDDYTANHVVNIAFVDADANMRLIRDKAPSKYMREFKRQNKDLAANVANSHMFELDDTIWKDDYAGFLDARIERIRDWLAQRLITREGDSAHHDTNLDDDDPADTSGIDA